MCIGHQMKASHFFIDKLRDHRSEQAVFAKNLVHRRALRMPQPAKFRRSRGNDRVGRNRFVGGRPKERREFPDQGWYVPEQLVAWKDVVWRNWHELLELVQPPRRERLMRRFDALSNGGTEIGRDSVRHGTSFSHGLESECQPACAITCGSLSDA
jgi:hypothetical protein